MKRAYVRPTMVGERFVANEYVAACGDNGTVYNFECNAGEKSKSYNVYYYKNNQKKFIPSDNPFNRAQFPGYHPCGATHEANAKDEFISGFIDDQSTLWKDEKIPVMIWTEKGNNVHCTLKLDMKDWETVKS